MKRISKRELCKLLVAWLLVVSMVLPMLPTGLVAQAEDSEDTFIATSADKDEMNKTMPTLELERNAELLASVDLNSTNGTFSGSSTYADAERIDLTDASVMDDELTLKEVQNIDKEYSIVFRARLGDMGWRNQPVFALRKTGATGWADSIFIGVPGSARTDGFVDNLYYKYLIGGNTNDYSQLSDTDAAYTMSSNASPSIDGNWHTFAIVQTEDNFYYYMDGNLYWYDKETPIYINGTSIGKFFEDETSIQAYIGSFDSTKNQSYNLKGSMDYYQFYKGALSETEIQSLSNDADDVSGVVDADEMNRIMPKVIYDVDLLASVDLNSTNGTFSGGTYTSDSATSATTIDMTDATVMNDELTLREVQNLDKKFSIVFRAKLEAIAEREQAVFALRKSTASKWQDSLFVGVPGSNFSKNGITDCLYYKYQIGATSQLQNTIVTHSMSTGKSPTLDGSWHTIAIVQDSEQIIYYLDGVEKYTGEQYIKTDSSIGNLFAGAEEFQAYIGAFATNQNANESLKGLMDYYQFYKGALSKEQVTELSSATEDSACENKKVKYVKSEVEANYRIYDESTETYTYVAPTMNGYLFAGWYKTEDCTDASNALKAGEEVPSTVYALFVPQHILNVKAQITANLTNDDLKDDDAGAIRFITSVDSLNYQKAGFYFDIEGGATGYEGANNKVFSKLYYTDPKTGERGDEMSYEPGKVFCSQSKYFKTFTFYNLPESLYDTDITATPFWVTLDGTTVCGISETKTINERRTENWVYLAGNSEDVETTGADAAGNGSKEAPYATLNYALANVEDGGVVCLLGDYAETGDFSWGDHDKDISITGLTNDVKLDFTKVDDNGTVNNTTLNIHDAVTFSGITLDFTANTRVYANCNRLKIDEDVTSKAIIRVYGAGTSNVTGNTDVTLLAGNYNVVYGGGDGNVDVDGSTKLYIAGNANSEFDFTDAGDNTVQIFGGSWKGNITGQAEIYVGGDVNKNLDWTTDKKPASIYGGSNGGTDTSVKSTKITIEGNAKFNVICGGGSGSAVTESTNVTVGGNVNQDLPFVDKDVNKAIIFGGGEQASTNTANLTVKGNANFHAIYGGGRGANSTTGTANVTISGNVNAGTDLTNHGHLSALYGGSNLGTVTNTDVTVTENAKFSYIYGAGYQDTVTNAKLTIGTMGATDSDTTGVKVYGMYGGSREGTTGSTKLIMNSGKVVQVFGGSYLANVSGNTDVQLLGGTVTRRVYGGCYNDADVGLFTTTWNEPLYQVTGNTNITISPNVTLSLTEDVDKGVISGSRYKERFEGEMGTIILLNDIYSSGSNWDNVIGRQDSTSSFGNPKAYNYLVDASSGGTVYSQGDTLLIVPDVIGETVTVEGVDSSNLVENGDGTYTLTLPEIGKDEQKIITIQF